MTYRILVVDDELPALDRMKDLLQQEELVEEVTLFSHAEQALEWAVLHQPDIIFLDIQMPGIHGLEFANRLLQASLRSEVVFVTAYHQYALQAFELSAVDYILKPVKQERLSQTLSRIHRRYASSRLAIREEGESKEDNDCVPPSSKDKVGSDKSRDRHLSPEVGEERPYPRIYCLGRLRVQSANGEMKWHTAKVKELFAYLLYKGEVSLEQMIEDVFPHSEPSKGKAYVHTCVYQIRRAVQELDLQEYIQIKYSDRMYRLQLREVWQDREAFAHGVSKQAGIEAIEEQTLLYQGDWCEGLDSMWMLSYREELRDRFLWLMEDKIDYYRKHGDGRMALANARRLLTLDPWNEHYALRIAEIYMEAQEKGRAKQFILDYIEQYEREWGEPLPEAWYEQMEDILEQ